MSITGGTKKAAIYCRLSEEDRNKSPEDDSASIQNQKSMLVKYAISQGWDIYNIYSDDDYTGADRNRPEFKKLLEDARLHKFDIILCKTQSRFTRELELVEKYIHGLFPLWNIRFVSIVDNADTENRGNKKSRQINGLVNEWYLEDLSDNIKGVLTDRRKDGYHIGSFALYGYKKDPEKKGHLLIDEEAAQIVREVFQLFDAGYGKTQIARILNERGIPNPTEYKRRQGLRYRNPETKQSTLWKYYSIADMLRNEMYIGNMVQGKRESISYKTKKSRPRPKEIWYRKENTHEAIIEQGLWERVQKKLSEKAKPFDTGKVGIFARKVKCMNCGYFMRSKKSHNKYYLQCSTSFVAKDACIGSFIPQEELKEYILSELKKLIEQYLNPDLAEQLLTVENGNQDRYQANLEKELSGLKRKHQEMSNNKSQLYIDKVNGIISQEDFIELNQSLNQKRKEYEEKIDRLEEYIRKLEDDRKKICNKRELLQKYIMQTELTRDIMETLIDYVEVGKRTGNRRSGGIPIKIHWKF